MTSLIPKPGVTLAQVKQCIADAIQPGGIVYNHVSARVATAIGAINLDIAGKSYQGTRNENVETNGTDTPQSYILHTVSGITNGKFHDIRADYIWRRGSTTGDAMFQIFVNAVGVGVPVSVEVKDSSANISVPDSIAANIPLDNGDVVELRFWDDGSSTTEVKTGRLVIQETAELMDVAAPVGLSVSTPSTAQNFDVDGSQQTVDVSVLVQATASGGSGSYTYAWAISNSTGTGTQPQFVGNSDTAQTAQPIFTAGPGFNQREFTLTVTVTDTVTGQTGTDSTFVTLSGEAGNV